MATRWITALAGIALLLNGGEARANGKFPAAEQLVVDPSDQDRIAVRTTFGILVTNNAGADWRLVCESAAGYQDVEPPIAITHQGALLAGLSLSAGTELGVRVSSPDGCDWSLATGIAAGDNIVDVSISRSEPAVAVALATLAGQSTLYRSSDGGASFQAVSDLPPGFAGYTLDVSPSDPSRVYVSGVSTSEQGQLARSEDAGQSWQVAAIDGSDLLRAPFIGALHPSDPDIVYVRLDGSPGELLVTRDGGASWTRVWTAPSDYLRGLALSPDGARIAAGTAFDGAFVATVPGPGEPFVFEPISDFPVRGLTWAGRGLYAMFDEVLGAPFGIGLSADGAGEFEPLLELSCVGGPLDCPAASSVGAECPAVWPALSDQLGTSACGATPSSSSSSNAGAGGSAAAPPPAASGPGCSCRLGERRPSGWWLAAVALLLVRRRT